MLGGVEDYIIKKLLEEYYSNDESKVPYVDYIGSVPTKINPTLAISYGIDVKSDKASKTYKFASSLPPADEWLETLVGPEDTRSLSFGEYCAKEWIRREPSQTSLSSLWSNTVQLGHLTIRRRAFFWSPQTDVQSRCCDSQRQR